MPEIKDILAQLDGENRLRTIPQEATGMIADLSSNDYMGLGELGDGFREEFLNRLPDAAFTSSASRLLSQRQKYHFALEEMLEGLYGKPALLFNSGYHANVGCTGALTLPGTLFVCDKLIHASMVDGLRIAGSVFKRFPHNDLSKLEMILNKECRNYERVVVMAESIYSMDGDETNLTELVKLKHIYPNLLLYIDEAHAFGVRGERGLGVAEEKGLIDEIDLLIGTFGKAAASAGAFAVCSEEMKSLLVNCARPFIFSTALPPVNAAWSILMTEKLIGMKRERLHLAELSRRFSSRIEEISGVPTGSTSQIIPYLTGDAARAIAIARTLRDAGFLALPIRRPTVPPGGERIRFSLNANLNMKKLSPLFDVLRDERIFINEN